VRRLLVIGLAAVFAVAPLPPDAVERFYSTTTYARAQRVLTGSSNGVPLALFDVVCVAVVLWWIAAAARDVLGRRRRGWTTLLGRLTARTLVITAGVYLAFLGSWGLNYRRVPLAVKLRLDPAAVSAEAVRTLAEDAVAALNGLYDEALADRTPPDAAIDPRLAEAFGRTQTLLGISRHARPARPKVSLLDPYFRAGAVQGMTAPFFLETLVPSDLLPVERPTVVAHEWSHLAGFADEAEAGFVAWLTCLRGPPGARYSGWLALYVEASHALPAADRDEIASRLGPGPRDDLRAIAERWRRNVRPAVSSAGWRMYDQYLKANRVEAGAASYGHVLRLVVGTELGKQESSTGVAAATGSGLRSPS
jgi:hypothetical protein